MTVANALHAALPADGDGRFEAVKHADCRRNVMRETSGYGIVLQRKCQ